MTKHSCAPAQAMNINYLRPKAILGDFGDLHTRWGVLISNEDWPSATCDSQHHHKKELWTKRQVLETLIGMNMYISPHLRTSSLNLWHNKPKLNLAIHLRYHLGDVNEVYSADKEFFGLAENWSADECEGAEVGGAAGIARKGQGGSM
ncbi:hypothetical protein HBI56_082290 [Parastagonospora nodorum]|uniref:Uncharacterized protein n=2 Tax=Phaeosphaeria nodorum (strain SN15 / ATCC MYA-4574 / FGSC 10173) TaxID=321614 RepID=A0A7U2I8A2_PHANO|nr:hypothetical protein SNOG_10609 [Parastagonospora nodorum SN15]KAH3913533.1 hypothetical protein HBH56_104280 [Parastagonospora nodorum]EAT82003.1 hypothetical protein SNOG_10609 [Parastagonospora nodorum SN15]KAH3929594.1 hypothetical protein HBH54_126130 [Parastagonospora nodorum]KAH3951590.1 hypothetical protein HBH53_060130 [Parastagonospora nodorum]KAH3975443.1 hypothetical protein HBH52_126720 [Parastagonospora nodorum]